MKEIEDRAIAKMHAVNAERTTPGFKEFREDFLSLCKAYVLKGVTEEKILRGEVSGVGVRHAAVETFLMEAYLLSVVTSASCLDGDIEKHLTGISKAVNMAVASYLNEEADEEVAMAIKVDVRQ